MLVNVYYPLVSKYGFSNNLFDPGQTAGNIVFLYLFMGALPLQPCNPTFPSARNAIIQADANRYGGANRCLLWKAFASRGLGVKAANHHEDFPYPLGWFNGGCTSETPVSTRTPLCPFGLSSVLGLVPNVSCNESVTIETFTVDATHLQLGLNLSQLGC